MDMDVSIVYFILRIKMIFVFYYICINISLIDGLLSIYMYKQIYE